MNRHLKVSLTLAALSLTTVGLLTGCGTEEPVNTNVDNQAETQAAIRNAIAKAEADLAAAKTELQTVIENGDTASSQQLTDAINNLNSAIETAKRLAADNDAAIKSELLGSIEAAKVAAMEASANSLKAAVEELESAMVVGDLETQDSLLKAMEAFNATLEANKKLANESDTSMKAELLAAIEATKKEASDLITKKMEAATKELQDVVTNNKIEMNGELEQTVQTLTNSIEAAKQLALGSDVAMREELEAAINNSKIEATNAINAAIEAAMQEFDAKLVAGGQATLDKFKLSLDSVNASIEAAKKLAADNDIVVKEEIEAKIEAVKTELAGEADAALKALETKLMAELDKVSKDSASDVAGLVKDFDAMVAELEAFATAGDAAVKADFEKQLGETKSELTQVFMALYQNLSKELTDKIETGDKALSNELTEALDEIEAFLLEDREMIEANKAELEQKIADANAEVVAALTAKIDALAAEMNGNLDSGLNASAEELAAKLAELTEAVEAAKKFATDADGVVKAELRAEITTMVEDVKGIAQRALDAAVEELTIKIEDKYNLNQESLTQAVSDLQAMIADAKALAADADATIKAELEAKIAEANKTVSESMTDRLDALKAELEAKILAGGGANADALEAAIAALNANVEAAKQFATDADAQLKAELEKAIADADAAVVKAVDEKIAELEAALRAEIAAGATDTAAKFEEFKADLDEIKGLFAQADADLKAELEKKFADADVALMTSVEQKIADVKAELEKAIADAVFDSSDVLTDKLDEYDALLTEYKSLVDQYKVDAEAAIKAGDEALAAEIDALDKKIDDEKAALLEIATGMLADTKAELEGLIAAGDEKLAADLVAAKSELEKQIADVKAITDAIIADYATTESVEAAIADLRTELTEAIEATKNAGMLLSDWNVATDTIVGAGGSLSQLDAILSKYQNKINIYADGDFAKVLDYYNEYYVRLIRVANPDEVEGILAEFDEKAATVRTISDAIYDAIMEVGKTVDDVEYDADKDGLAAVKALLDRAAALNNAEVNKDIESYGVDGINLVELYESYMDQYNALLRKSDGKGIKDRMDELVAKTVVITDNEEDPTSFKFMLLTIRNDYNTWISDAFNSLDNVEGFAETYAKFVEAEARYASLIAAKAEAEQINKTAQSLKAEIEANGATIKNKEALELLNNRVMLWTDMYFADQYAAEIDVSDNWKMVDHAALDEVNKLFEDKVAAFKASAKKFADAVDAVGEVNLMSWDEINTALTEYGNLVLSRDLNDFNYLFDEEDTPATYYNKLVSIYAEYRTLKASAYNDYVAAFGAVDGLVVNIYDGAKVDGIVKWYETYGVFDENGDITFDNGAAGTGYVLGSATTVDMADFLKIATLKADYETLVDAKTAEVEELVAKIEGIGNVTFGRGDYIREVRAAYDAYLAGTKAPGEYLDEQFKIDPSKPGYEVSNFDTLEAAETKLADLENQVKNIKIFMAGMKDYDGYSDFIDDADRDTFEKYLAVVVGMMDKFQEANSGSLENAFSAEELAKVETAKLAIVKYDNTVAIIKDAAAYVEVVGGLKLPADDIDASALAANTVRDDIAADIDAATSAEEVAALKTLADAKFAELKECLMVYEQYLAVLMNDATIEEAVRTELGFKMSLSYVTTINRVVSVDNVEDVEQSAKFVADELESLYPLG